MKRIELTYSEQRESTPVELLHVTLTMVPEFDPGRLLDACAELQKRTQPQNPFGVSDAGPRPEAPRLCPLHTLEQAVEKARAAGQEVPAAVSEELERLRAERARQVRPLAEKQVDLTIRRLLTNVLFKECVDAAAEHARTGREPEGFERLRDKLVELEAEQYGCCEQHAFGAVAAPCAC